MRWLLAPCAGFGLLFLVTGCHHTAGVCDCDLPPTLAGATLVPSAAPPLLRPEPILTPPKANESKAPEKKG